MLVLSRKAQESIVINDNIKVVVLSVRRNQVRLGIEAPADIPIHRGEIDSKMNHNYLPSSDRFVISDSVTNS